MKKTPGYLDQLMDDGEFHFSRLTLPGIDNTPVFQVNRPEMVAEETCLFHRKIAEGSAYLAKLHTLVSSCMTERRPVPVARFADGEYAFYRLTLGCNGLYRQAESVKAIKSAMPMHLNALRRLADIGQMAPLIFPEDIGRKKRRGLFSFLQHSDQEPSSATFLNFLRDNGIAMTGDNYLPFYIVYAYLTSEDFARLVDGRKLMILNSEFNSDACRTWFDRFFSRPEIFFTRIPGEYIATRWGAIREDILSRVSSDADLCLVGAGVGALPVCADVAERYSIPVLDAGHVLNMMNDREDKSNGMRLYTLRKKDEGGVVPLNRT